MRCQPASVHRVLAVALLATFVPSAGAVQAVPGLKPKQKLDSRPRLAGVTTQPSGLLRVEPFKGGAKWVSASGNGDDVWDLACDPLTGTL